MNGVNKINVLIAEDNQVQAEYFKSLLPVNEYTCQVINNGEKVLAYLLAHNEEVDIVLLDYHLPGLNGINILDELSRKINFQFGVIFISSDNAIQTVVKAMRAGAMDFIPKSGNLNEEIPLKIRKVYRYVKSIKNIGHLKQKLEESELKFTTAFYNNPSTMVITRFADGVFLDVNKIFINKIGYSREEVLGLNSLDLNLFINKGQREKFREILARDGRVRDFEMQIKAKTGEIKTGLFSAEVITLQGEPCLLSVMSDITAQKMAEAELKNLLKYSTELIENNLHGLLIVKDKKLVYVNQKACALTGYSKNEFFNQLSEKWEDLIHPQDVEGLQEKIEEISKESATDITFEIRAFPKRQKNYIWLAVNINRVNYFGEKALQYSFTDISQRKNAEREEKKAQEQAEFLLQFVPSAILTYDMNNRVNTCNKKALELTGYTRKELIGKNILDILRKSSDEEDRSTPYPRLNQDRVLIKKNGGLLQVSKNTDLLKDIDGKSIGYITSFEDVTEQKIYHDKLVQSEIELKHLNATKDKFFSIIAHDLKNPFNNILGFSELILRNVYNYDAEKVKGFAEVIYNASNKSYELLQNLLEWANSQRGKIVVNPDVFDLNQLVVENINLLNNMAIKKNISINFMPSKHANVFADANMIRTVIRNLLSNAIKFTPHQGEIFLSIEEGKQENILKIEDNGIGISQDKINKLFRIDQNISTEGTDGEEGTGLGLILCLEFIDKNRGRIWAESEKDKGSSFFVALPAEAYYKE